MSSTQYLIVLPTYVIDELITYANDVFYDKILRNLPENCHILFVTIEKFVKYNKSKHNHGKNIINNTTSRLSTCINKRIGNATTAILFNNNARGYPQMFPCNAKNDYKKDVI